MATWIGRHSPAAAAKLIDRLEETCGRVAGMPGIGRRCAELGLPAEVRSVPCGSYIVSYRPLNDPTFPVEILRDLHGARDQRTALADETSGD